MNRAVAGCRQMISMMSSPLKRPLSPRNSFSPVVVVLGAVLEVPGDTAVGPDRVAQAPQRHVLCVPERPTGEGAGALLDVLLGVAAHAHGEQLQELPAVVLVDRAVVVLVVVQPDDHGRVFGQLHEQRPEAAESVATKHPDLVVIHLAERYLRVPGSEDAVPEQWHLLPERSVGVDHAVQPEYRIAADAHHPGDLVVIPPDEVDGHGLGLAAAEQLLDGGLVALLCVGLNLVPSRAKRGSTHQVRDQLGVCLAHVASWWPLSTMALAPRPLDGDDIDGQTRCQDS